MNEKVKDLVAGWRNGTQRMGTYEVDALVSEIERLEKEAYHLQKQLEYVCKALEMRTKEVDRLEQVIEEVTKDHEATHNRLTQRIAELEGLLIDLMEHDEKASLGTYESITAFDNAVLSIRERLKQALSGKEDRHGR